MKKILSIGLILLVIFFLLVLACKKPLPYSTTPEIKFKSVSVSNELDSLGNQVKLIKLIFTVFDGDGDVGIYYTNSTDSNKFYPGFTDLGNKDLFTTLYQKIDGQYIEVPLKIPNNFSIPYTEQTGQDKSLKADIQVSMQMSLTFYTFDTIKYSFFMYDREKHLSNIEETPEIPADTLGLIEAK